MLYQFILHTKNISIPYFIMSGCI
uniref:Uncharacterized protein n=1 Tax=Anguilla anguilla TaxID=7936 RepID=A0A0E9U9V4_ANGAN